MSEIVSRKTEHLDIVLKGGGAQMTTSTGLERVRFTHIALPEMDFADIDLSCTFLGRQMAAPFLISSMTGGPAEADRVNSALAEAAGQLGIAFAVGSQRVALEDRGAAGLGRQLRDLAGNAPILANFGAAQLQTWKGSDQAQRAVDMIGADALIIHLNPLQEAIQPEGDRNWRGLLAAIEGLAIAVPFPLVVKEIGNGISGSVARRLVDAGVQVIDVAGAGGTSWAMIESRRNPDPAMARVGATFANWGIPTAEAICAVRAACPETKIIASGGIANGLDAARAIRIGGDIVGQAAGVLKAAMDGPEAVIAHFEAVIAELRTTCFCTGSRDLTALRRAELLDGHGGGPPAEAAPRG